MAIGLSTINLVNKWLNILSGSSFTGIAGVYVQLHTDDPGAAGTANVSAETTRKLTTWDAADSEEMTMAAILQWTAWSVGAETISHISLWDAATAGNFLWSGALGIAKTVSNDDALNLTSLTVGVTPLAQ